MYSYVPLRGSNKYKYKKKYKTILHLSLQEKTLYKHDMLRWLLSVGKNAQSLLTMVAQKVISSSRSSEGTSAPIIVSEKDSTHFPFSAEELMMSPS